MSKPYQEVVLGQPLVRPAPANRHEQICLRLHEALLPALAELTQFQLLAPRAQIEVLPNSLLRPDLTLLSTETGRPYLIAEVISSADHLPDTVEKKTIYEDLKLPRLWMIDPRYDNLEVYHASSYGITLQKILYRTEILIESAVPQFALPLSKLFVDPP